jgi:hypothetical protein
VIREVITHTDFCGGLIVAVVANFVARLAVHGLHRFARAMTWAGIVAVLGVCVWAFVEFRPHTADDLLGTVVVAWIAGCGAALAVAVVLAPLAAIGDWWQGMVRQWRDEVAARVAERRRLEKESRREAERQAAEAARRNADEEYRRSLPPPATREEREVAIRKRYEDRLRLLDAARLSDIERQAAEERAKQQYLRDLDELLQ